MEHIPIEIYKIIGKKHIITSTYRTQSYDSVMFEYFCIRFIDFLLKGKSLLDYTSLFCPNEYNKND